MRRATTRPTLTCTPIGDMLAWPEEHYRCVGDDCDAIIRHVRAALNVNDWADETLSGERVRDDRPKLLRDDPKRWWDELAAAMLAGDDRAGNAYSVLSGLGDYSGMRTMSHYHRAGERIAPRPDREPPFCCSSPMWASPDGWACRKSGRVFPYAA